MIISSQIKEDDWSAAVKTDTGRGASVFPPSDLGCHDSELKLLQDQGQQGRQKPLNSQIKKGRSFYCDGLGNRDCVWDESREYVREKNGKKDIEQ